MLYELCEAFGDYRDDPVKESNNEEVARDEQTAFPEKFQKDLVKKIRIFMKMFWVALMLM